MATVLQRHEQPAFYTSMYSIFQRGRTDTHDQPARPTIESAQYIEAEAPVNGVGKDVSPSPASSRGQPTTPSGSKRRKIDSQTALPSVSHSHDTAYVAVLENHPRTPAFVGTSDYTHLGQEIGYAKEPAPPRTGELESNETQTNSALLLPTERHVTGGLQEPHDELLLREISAATEKKSLIVKLGKNGKLKQIPPNPTRTSPRTRSTISTRPAPPSAELKNKRLKLRNGKLAQSLVARIKYRDQDGDVQRISDRITEILSRPAAPQKSTHPFFNTKPKQQNLDHPPTNGAAQTSEALKSDNKVLVAPSKPVAWSDLAFKSKRPIVPIGLQPQRPIWPPRELQHVGVEHSMLPTRPLKATEKRTIRPRMTQSEFDTSATAIALHPESLSTSQRNGDIAFACRMRFVPGVEVLTQLDCARLGELSPVSLRVREHILRGASHFDRAEAAGPLMWPQQYAPTCWEEVLQPAAQTLHDWLKTLAVHNVKQGLDNPLLKQMHKSKKRGRKPKDELDDFIVDDDEEVPFKAPKNAILLVGPNGCGKTAAVFAAAKQLNFEVFEIHAGEHRSQKDIFDRVGNMTQNHLVRTGQQDSRGSSLAPDDLEAVPRSQEDTQKMATTKFFAPFQTCPAMSVSRPSTPQPGRKEQKQSLILLEEVDNVFDEDKSFWTGVQSLIQKSKRPVVMTCNDISNIPRDELELHQILYCAPPDVDATVDYLTYVAAAEGHVLPSAALRRLYLSTGHDLRATLTQLNFWCQMTVGSVRGGLDWYVSQPQSVREGSAPRYRVFSEDTYRDDLDTNPEHASDLEMILSFGQSCLEVEPNSLDISTVRPGANLTDAIGSVLDSSDGDLLDASAQPLFYSKMLCSHDYYSVRDAISNHRIRRREQHENVRTVVSMAFEPLMDEPSVFPPSQGRLAPSLDCSQTSILTDIAPYVRTIVAFDQRLEQQRDELFSSQGKKSRNTRAARAAAEGGDKATSRREKWFSKDLDMNAVMATAGIWPQWSASDGDGADQDFEMYGQSLEQSSPQS